MVTVIIEPTTCRSEPKNAAGGQWKCPNCGQRLADVVGDRVVVRVSGRMISLPLRDSTDQSCPKCGTHSKLRMLPD